MHPTRKTPIFLAGLAAAGVAVVSLAAVGLLFTPPANAQSLVQELSWTHPSPQDVQGFRVHYGFEPGKYTITQDVQLPLPVGNTFEVVLPVLYAPTYYFAVTAYDSEGRESAFSNERCRGMCSEGLGIPGAPFVISWNGF